MNARGAHGRRRRRSAAQQHAAVPDAAFLHRAAGSVSAEDVARRKTLGKIRSAKDSRATVRNRQGNETRNGVQSLDGFCPFDNLSLVSDFEIRASKFGALGSNPVGMTGIALRPITPEDVSFLAGVYASTRAEELAVTGWSDEEKAVFCRRQFDAQSAHYRENYPGASLQIIERDGVSIGRLYVAHWEREIRIMDISLLPEASRRRDRDAAAARIARGSALRRQIAHDPRRAFQSRAAALRAARVQAGGRQGSVSPHAVERGEEKSKL